MAVNRSSQTAQAILERADFEQLIAALTKAHYQVIGPTLNEGAITYGPVESAADLPVGWVDEQDGGRYRLAKAERQALFDYVVGPRTWKHYLFPPSHPLWQAQRRGKGFMVDDTKNGKTPRYAFLGVRSCELHAIQIQDRVFNNGSFADSGYLQRRAAAFIVAVNCVRPGGTCFCTSMNTGPHVGDGYDLALTELLTPERHVFLAEAGSVKGSDLLAQLPQRPATAADRVEAAELMDRAAQQMGREMPADTHELLKRNLEHPRWDDVAKRCLNCANCTMVCPTCFCSTVEDVTDFSGESATRWRHWDSCFTLDFSYIHGGSIRREGRSRYRQWMTHKLSHWHDQFGSSGCVGCGRCITWCPVGIDITEEARAIRDSDGGQLR